MKAKGNTMLNCKQTTVLLSQSQDRRLSRKERLLLRLHLMFCPHCRRYRKQMAFIRQSMRQWVRDK